jgi:sortase (surface protein transpeptidase)
MTLSTSVKGSAYPWRELTVVLVLIAMGSLFVRQQRQSSAGSAVAQRALTPSSELAARPWRKWWMLTAALLLIGAGCLVLGLRQYQHPLAGPVKTQHVKATVTKSATAPVKAKMVPLVAARSTPTELEVPAIGLAVSLSTLGLNADGTVQVPTDIQQPGWFRLGPSPGQMGSAVILGHVDSYQGPAVFFKLRSLVAGDLITVNLADGRTAQFKVTSVAMYLKSNFPDQAVYGAHGSSELQLVTCAGTFDTQTGHYLSNIVVYSSLVALTPKTQAPPSSTASGV